MGILTINKKRLIVIALMTMLLFGFSKLSRASVSPSGTELPPRLIFYFANNSSLLMRDYYTNQSTLEKLDEMLNNPDFISGVDSITIFGSAWKHPGVYNDRINVLPSVFNWDVLIDLIQNDPLVPNREEALRILNSPVSNQLKVNQIKQLNRGSTDFYITKNFAKYMRTATSVFFRIKEKQKEVQEPEIIEIQNDSVPIVVEEIEEIIPKPVEFPEIISPTINVEVEVPIGEHFSLAGE